MFVDRADAGRKLAKRLGRFKGASDTVVLGVPRGGVVVAAEVARELGLPLDVVMAAKVGAPGNPEYAIGSVAADGDVFVNPSSGFTREEVIRLSGPAKAKIAEKTAMFRGNRLEVELAGRTAIIVDDGLATGLTAEASVSYVRRQHAARIILATPVASDSAVKALERSVDEIIAVEIPREFAAVGQFYESFGQTSDEEVERLMRNKPDIA